MQEYTTEVNYPKAKYIERSEIGGEVRLREEVRGPSSTLSCSSKLGMKLGQVVKVEIRTLSAPAAGRLGQQRVAAPGYCAFGGWKLASLKPASVVVA